MISIEFTRPSSFSQARTGHFIFQDQRPGLGEFMLRPPSSKPLEFAIWGTARKKFPFAIRRDSWFLVSPSRILLNPPGECSPRAEQGARDSPVDTMETQLSRN